MTNGFFVEHVFSQYFPVNAFFLRQIYIVLIMEKKLFTVKQLFESPFNKVAGLQRLQHRCFFREIYEIF